LTFYSVEGGKTPLRISGRPHFLLWVPGTAKALFKISGGQGHPYQLVECSTGEPLWGISLGTCLGADGSHLFFRSGAREVVAVDVATGKVAAEWVSPTGHSPPWGGRASRVLRVADKLYLLTGEQFSEIQLEDIAAKRNGWRAPRPPRPPGPTAAELLKGAMSE
jgi:hypothetical protein